MYHYQKNKWYLPISKLHSILAVANLLAHDNISQICYCSQIHYKDQQLTAVLLTTMGVLFILLAMEHKII